MPYIQCPIPQVGGSGYSPTHKGMELPADFYKGFVNYQNYVDLIGVGVRTWPASWQCNLLKLMLLKGRVQ
ncbi:MAG: hypothetical protein KME23_23455 [Goleter apudmare HA4340-LM2]|jgi:hypothetical protein|nr:hypothetical protein [Goleter apudmare HA4340-LM2]